LFLKATKKGRADVEHNTNEQLNFKTAGKKQHFGGVLF
jgi:hypothetical protein